MPVRELRKIIEKQRVEIQTIIEEKDGNLLKHVFWNRGSIQNDWYHTYEIIELANISPLLVKHIEIMICQPEDGLYDFISKSGGDMLKWREQHIRKTKLPKGENDAEAEYKAFRE